MERQASSSLRMVHAAGPPPSPPPPQTERGGGGKGLALSQGHKSPAPVAAGVLNLSFPAPGTDTVSNAPSFLRPLRPGQRIHWATEHGEQEGVIEGEARTADFLMDSPSPRSGGSQGGPGGIRILVRCSLSQPKWVCVDGQGRKRALARRQISLREEKGHSSGPVWLSPRAVTQFERSGYGQVMAQGTAQPLPL